jgi:hypothetical protein
MKASKLAIVTTFVMDGINHILAGSWDDMYPEIDCPDINIASNYGEVEAANLESNHFDIWFGGDMYQVKVSKIRRIK